MPQPPAGHFGRNCYLGVSPNRSYGRLLFALHQRIAQSRDNRNSCSCRMNSRKGHHVVFSSTLRLERNVSSTLKQILILTPKLQSLPSDPHLNASISAISQQIPADAPWTFGRRTRHEIIKETLSQVEIHGTPVVWIDETEIPQLLSLINVGDAGAG